MSSSASATLAPEIWAVVLAEKDGTYEPIGPDCYRPRMVGADGIGKEDGGQRGTRQRRDWR